ncbi:30S ribosomal protein S8 [Candidatus Peregrinibacteria bacterium]|nr:30S ribosomal protein S8 [Candidatus Peregrinibacteria bacterium]
MYTDTISDLLTRIRNAKQAKKDLIRVPHSKMKAQILEVLKQKNYILKYQIEGEVPNKELVLELNPEKEIFSIKRVSKPGQRIYKKSAEIKKVNGGLGINVVSTPKGIMSDDEARKSKLGGEIICEVI